MSGGGTRYVVRAGRLELWRGIEDFDAAVSAARRMATRHRRMVGVHVEGADRTPGSPCADLIAMAYPCGHLNDFRPDDGSSAVA